MTAIPLDRLAVKALSSFMIRSWGHDIAQDIWQDKDSKAARRLSQDVRQRAQLRLALLNRARSLHDLKGPALRLEALRHDQTGRHAIRVNLQYRITFRWHEGEAYEVRVEDYHS